MFTTSFISVPLPVSPRKKLAFPIASNRGADSLNRASSPAAKKISWP